MKKVPLVWAQLREWNGSLQTAFETLCNHFAAYEVVPQGSIFVPNAPPDGGVESYWILPDGSEWGFQAKFFTAKPDSSEWGQIDKSVKRALETHPKLSRYTICMPIDRADPRKEDKQYFKDAWDNHEEKWISLAKEESRTVRFDYWGETELSERSTKGLLRLFSDHLPLLVKVMQAFKDVDDPYVSERLYCVAYGCVFSTG